MLRMVCMRTTRIVMHKVLAVRIPSHEVVIHSFMQPGEEFGHAHLEAQLRASFKGPARIHCPGASLVLICYNASTCPRALLTLF
jgi:hypothetical protein